MLVKEGFIAPEIIPEESNAIEVLQSDSEEQHHDLQNADISLADSVVRVDEDGTQSSTAKVYSVSEARIDRSVSNESDVVVDDLSPDVSQSQMNTAAEGNLPIQDCQ
ncbi:hypothetical protein BGZ76_007979, partial [Entomortierella beljakovae]